MITGFLNAIFLTVIIEVLAAFVVGQRKVNVLFLIAAVNLITNPLLNLIIFIAYNVGIFSFLLLFVLEVLVILVEFQYYRIFAGLNKPGSLRLSVILNLCSFVAGLCVTALF